MYDTVYYCNSYIMSCLFKFPSSISISISIIRQPIELGNNTYGFGVGVVILTIFGYIVVLDRKSLSIFMFVFICMYVVSFYNIKSVYIIK